MAGLPRSPLILCLSFQDIPSHTKIINARDIQPTNFLMFISWCRLWESFVRFYLSSTIPFSDKKATMVQTRSKATNPSHQESRDASNHPHRDRQSVPAMQPSSVQHAQSMAAIMAEFTRQNQELIREINFRRQRYEADGEEQGQS